VCSSDLRRWLKLAISRKSLISSASMK
jgi:hypothetical protein